MRTLLLEAASALWVAVPTAGATVFATWETTHTWTPSLVAGGAAGCAVLLSRPLQAWGQAQIEAARTVGRLRG